MRARTLVGREEERKSLLQYVTDPDLTHADR